MVQELTFLEPSFYYFSFRTKDRILKHSPAVSEEEVEGHEGRRINIPGLQHTGSSFHEF